MFCGPFVFLYLTGPEWVEAQEIVAILLGAAVPQLMHYPFMPYMDLVSDNLTCGGRLTVFMVLFFSIIAVAGRVFAFPYLAWRTDQEIAKTEAVLDAIVGAKQTSVDTYREALAELSGQR